MNQERQQKLNSAAGKVGLAFRAIPIGTLTLMSISTFIYILNLFDSWGASRALCLSSTNTTNSLFSHLPSLLGNELAHDSTWHQLIGLLAFPFVASGVEQEVGTFQFLWLFYIGGLLTSLFYVLIVWMFSWIFPSWGYACVEGLTISFFTFLTIEGLNGRGLFELTSRFGLKIPRELYFIPYFILFAVILPLNSWFVHLFAVGTGYLYYLGLLEGILLPQSAINALETAGILSFYTSASSFMIKPGAVALPMPGGFRTEGQERENRASFVTQIANIIKPDQEKYAPIGAYHAGGLQWDEQHEDTAGLLPQNPPPNENSPLKTTPGNFSP